MSTVTINRGPGNEPQKMASISKAALIRKLPPGTQLTLIFTTHQGSVRKLRTVKKSSVRELELTQHYEKGPDESSYLKFEAGDECFETEGGFCVLDKDGRQVAYLWGHQR